MSTAASRVEDAPGSAGADLPYVEAVMNYVDPDKPIGAINDIEREKTTIPLKPHRVRIHDGRAITKQLALERTGFICIDSPSAVRNFFDPKEVKSVYHAETERLIKRLTGADKVLVFGEAVRDARAANPKHRPVMNVHIDYNVETIRNKARAALQPEEQHLADGHIVLINTWRPITEVESFPLAVADASTIHKGDLVHGPIAGDSRAGIAQPAGYNVAYNPAHRWYYIPRMQPHELLVFKLCDTDMGKVQWTAHSAFADPASRPGAPGRQSIELRTLAFFRD